MDNFLYGIQLTILNCQTLPTSLLRGQQTAGIMSEELK
jgi:hypothetical protein